VVEEGIKNIVVFFSYLIIIAKVKLFHLKHKINFFNIDTIYFNNLEK
jgi:hypothetical protein